MQSDVDEPTWFKLGMMIGTVDLHILFKGRAMQESKNFCINYHTEHLMDVDRIPSTVETGCRMNRILVSSSAFLAMLDVQSGE